MSERRDARRRNTQAHRAGDWADTPHLTGWPLIAFWLLAIALTVAAWAGIAALLIVLG